MSAFNYTAPAELFPTRSRLSRWQPVSYKRFDTAAEAIRYAIEELPPDLLVGAILEVDEERFDANGIRGLYAGAAYPLPRNDTNRTTTAPVAVTPPVSARRQRSHGSFK